MALAKAGAKVYITGRTLVAGTAVPGTLPGTAAEVTAAADATGLGGSCIACACDHADDAATRAVFERIKSENGGRLDVVVCNAYGAVGQALHGKHWWERESAEHYDASCVVGLRSNYLCSLLAARAMTRRRCGLIVNVSSFGALRAYTSVPYAISKSATDRMVADCAPDLRSFGVAIVSLWPGLIKTERLLQSKRGGKIGRSKAAESPEYVGRAIVALAADGDAALARTGKVVMSHELGAEFGFVDTDGNTPRDKVMQSLRSEMESPPVFWQPDWPGYVRPKL